MSSTGRGAERRLADAYETPGWCVELILKRLNVESIGRVFDPCCGSRVMSSVARRLNPDIVVTDMDVAAPEWLWSSNFQLGDFLAYEPDGIHPFCLMNPPYSRAVEFVEKAQKHCREVVALLSLAFMRPTSSRKGYVGRSRLLRQGHPDVYVLPRRPSFTGGRTDSVDYAWFHWHPAMSGKWEILWEQNESD